MHLGLAAKGLLAPFECGGAVQAMVGAGPCPIFDSRLGQCIRGVSHPSTGKRRGRNQEWPRESFQIGRGGRFPPSAGLMLSICTADRATRPLAVQYRLR